MGQPAPHVSSIRPAMQASRFYEGDAATLRAQVTRFIDQANVIPAGPPVRGVLAPHAGYLYSGAVAGAAYRAAQDQGFDRVLILGPSHFIDLDGAALTKVEAFATPLGAAPVDTEAVALLAGEPQFAWNEESHRQEHSIEVQIPFLQVALREAFSILPLTLGRVPAEGWLPLAASLERVLTKWAAAGRRPLIVASSDTYHGYDAAECERNDERIRELLIAMDPEDIMREVLQRRIMACGWLGLVLAMELTHRQGARHATPLQRSDSRAGGGPGRGYVVGYLSAAFQ